MSGTYRYQVCITRDGEGRHGATARGGAAEMKKIDRRAKRRQAARITRDSLRMMEADAAYDRDERERLEAEYLELFVDDDFNDDYWDGDFGNHPGDDDWDDPRDLYDWYMDEFNSLGDDLKCPAEVTAEREGICLGDLLARIRKEKGLD